MNTYEIQEDELLDLDPEPCGFCPSGIRWMFCFDKVWRCRTCVHDLAARNGWDQLPDPETVSESATVIQESPGAESDQTALALPFDD